MVTPFHHYLFRKDRALFNEEQLQAFFEDDALSFLIEGDFYAVPADAMHCPCTLARIAGAYADALAEEPSLQATLYWKQMLHTDVQDAGYFYEEGRTQLPPLTETALLVHILGLESHPQAVLSRAIDGLLMEDVGGMAQPHGAAYSPLVTGLVNAIARVLRPWSFEAPALHGQERALLLFLLADLGTSKARKLLHEEKKHAHRHAHAALLHNAVNRSLRRWQRKHYALSPKQRVVRAAATFRYLNHTRRHILPRDLDAHVVAEMLRIS